MKRFLSFLAPASAMACSVVISSAEGFTITTDMLKPIISSVESNIGVIFPVGIAIFAILVGIALIPIVVKMFLNNK